MLTSPSLLILLQGGAGSLPVLVIVVIVAAGLGLGVRQALQKSNAPPAFGSNPSVSGQVLSLMNRYRDAYIVATVTNGFGTLIKGAGVVIGGVLLLGGLFLISNGRLGDATFALGVVVAIVGVVSGTWFYVVGILVSAQAQILRASLDGAVNNSPFLTNDHRATIMSLPKS